MSELANDDETLSKSVQARIERNRQKALLIRQEKANKRLYSQIDKDNKSHKQQNQQEAAINNVNKTSVNNNNSNVAGGFLLEDCEPGGGYSKVKLVHKAGGLLLNGERPICEECNKTFLESFLYDNFSKSVCDDCRDKEEKHRLITKTEARERYLLKECDFEIREPALKFILKKNTNYKKFGEMKLYLECQVAERAAEIWGSDEKLEEEIQLRNENKNKMKKKKFEKKMLDLRKSVRGSLYDNRSTTHEHEYGDEMYHEVSDTYSRTCKTCSFMSTYEKM